MQIRLNVTDHRSCGTFAGSVYGFLINRFSSIATNVKASSIAKVAVYPPVASSTLLDAVATKDPTITVKVIRAILLGKCFRPKYVDVNAEVIVGQAP